MSSGTWAILLPAEGGQRVRVHARVRAALSVVPKLEYALEYNVFAWFGEVGSFKLATDFILF